VFFIKNESFRNFIEWRGFPSVWQCIRSDYALIGSGFNGVPGSGFRSRRAKMTQKSRQKLINIIFWSAGCSLLRAEGFSCNLDVLYGGQRLSKFIFFLSKKISFFQLYFLQFFVIKTLYPDPDSLKMLDPYQNQWIRIHNTVSGYVKNIIGCTNNVEID
jgi:hypothetical protein